MYVGLQLQYNLSIMQAIILKLLQYYPQQCLWMMIAVNKVTFINSACSQFVVKYYQ